MYADDAYTTIASNDITVLISMTKRELLNICDWLRVNEQSANPQKTEFAVNGHQSRISAINEIP